MRSSNESACWPESAKRRFAPSSSNTESRIEALVKEKADAQGREAAASRSLEAAKGENETRLAELERVNEAMRQQMAQEVAEAKTMIVELQALREREASDLRGLQELRERDAAELQERAAQGSAEADAIISEVRLAATRELDEQRRQGEALLASAKENWARKRAELGGRLEAREIERVELMARLEHIERRLAKAEQDLRNRTHRQASGWSRIDLAPRCAPGPTRLAAR